MAGRDEYLNFCPRCGKSDIDREGHGSPGIGVCRDCGTLFSILSVKLGQRLVQVAGNPDETVTAPISRDRKR
jgi:hypothetical protein